MAQRAPHEMAVGRGEHEGKPKPGKLKELHIIIGAKPQGGHAIEHHFHNEGNMRAFHEPKTHFFGRNQGEEAMAHIAKHAGFSAPAVAAEGGEQPAAGAAEENEETE
jgi:hypothetical protein